MDVRAFGSLWFLVCFGLDFAMHLDHGKASGMHAFIHSLRLGLHSEKGEVGLLLERQHMIPPPGGGVLPPPPPLGRTNVLGVRCLRMKSSLSTPTFLPECNFLFPSRASGN